MTYQAQYGLLFANEVEEPVLMSVPLTGVRIEAKVEGHCSRVTVVQAYENRESVPIEAVYVFPLEEGSAVCAFSVTVDGRRIEGKVLPRDEAFDLYDNATAPSRVASCF